MVVSVHEFEAYKEAQQQWRENMEVAMRSRDGWLTVVGLEWLKEGKNTIGSAEDADVKLPTGSAPGRVGILDFHNGKALFRVLTDERVRFNDSDKTPEYLQDDHAENGPTVVKVRDVSFFIIRRGTEYGVRIKDTNSPALLNFGGRHWFPVNVDYRVQGQFTPHAESKLMSIENSLGKLATMLNPGVVDFDLQGQHFTLEVFQEEPEKLWLIFRDATSGVSTYAASRYLKMPYAGRTDVVIDFNQAYHPPCAFTNFATCPFAPRQNRLTIPVEAGERL